MTNLKAIKEKFEDRFYSFDKYAIYSKNGEGVSNLENIWQFIESALRGQEREITERVQSETISFLRSLEINQLENRLSELKKLRSDDDFLKQKKGGKEK